MQLSEFDYILPEGLIARYALAERTHSRLLCVNRTTGETTHGQFRNIIDLLNPNDLLVLNNTRVIPARIFATKATGGKVEILIERMVSEKQALAHLRASKSIKIGTELFFAKGVRAIVEAQQDELWQLLFQDTDKTVLEVLHEQGEMPLPPYFKRLPEEQDSTRYQTVYAQQDGAVAAPTAGLHFDETLLTAIKEKNIKIVFVTLHVGAGTFQPIRVEDITRHRMHYEWMQIDAATCEAINETKQRGNRVIAVGTTSVRTLESAAAKSNADKLQPFVGNTNLFVYPGYRFNIVDAMITNFHLPKSSLLLLVSAFATRDIILDAYRQAIDNQYRFYSYGDAMYLY